MKNNPLHHIKAYGMAVLLGLLCLFANPLRAQEPISQGQPIFSPTLPNDDDTIIGGSDDLSFSSHIPMAGNSTLNRLLGLQTYDDPYSRFFCELEWITGGESAAFGFDIAYVPKHFGAYCSLLGDEYDGWFTLGAVWRPITKPATIDWQLYAGGALSWGWGYEFGTRIASNAKGNFNTPWCWWSGTLGIVNINGISYTSFGISLGLISLSPILIL